MKFSGLRRLHSGNTSTVRLHDGGVGRGINPGLQGFKHSLKARRALFQVLFIFSFCPQAPRRCGDDLCDSRLATRDYFRWFRAESLLHRALIRQTIGYLKLIWNLILDYHITSK
ncbi:hypothetical protein RRG08_058623 [Elysia crispata]|uniref:Uncharacterized protein n=1 Tax=Elysia crispata TaxID=231223 RepID=A0AAE0Z0V4_9GAST|nr:hypothetical protein RRG08_058623 [Elysia crispata]